MRKKVMVTTQNSTASIEKKRRMMKATMSGPHSARSRRAAGIENAKAFAAPYLRQSCGRSAASPGRIVSLKKSVLLAFENEPGFFSDLDRHGIAEACDFEFVRPRMRPFIAQLQLIARETIVALFFRHVF